MKKVITLCLFVFAMLIGNQTAVAQNSKLETIKEINAEASLKTEAIGKFVKLYDDQRDQLYTALKVYGQNIASFKNKPINEEDSAKNEKQLDDKVKAILSDEQYERYKAYLEEN